MINKHNLIRMLLAALAAVWLAFALSTPSDAGWYKKAKKAAKKAAHKVEENVKAEAKRATDNVSHEAKKLGGDISREGKKLAVDISREGKKFGGDISQEGKRFGGDISREGKKFAGDISSETKKFGRDINREFNKGLPAISVANIGRGLNRLGTNMDNAGTQFNVNTGRGSEQLGHNLTQGERHLTHNVDKGLDRYIYNVTAGEKQSFAPFFTKLMGAGLLTVFGSIPVPYVNPNTQFSKTAADGLHQLDRNIREGSTNVGHAVVHETERGVRNAWNETVGPPEVTDTKTSEKPTGKVCVDCPEEQETSSSASTASANKGKTKISSEDVSDPGAIFRAETNTGMKESTGGSTSIFKERTSTTGLGSSTESSSGLGGSQTMGKKETTSSQTSGGPKIGGQPKRR